MGAGRFTVVLGLVALCGVLAMASVREAIQGATRAQRTAELAVELARHSEERSHDATVRLEEALQRLEDVERLAIELQDGVPPGAYRKGFPPPGEDWGRPEPRRHAARKVENGP